MARSFYVGVGGAAAAAALLLHAGCGGEQAPEIRVLKLVEVSEEVGLAGFRHVGGRPDKAYLPDTTGSGVCAFDYDRDGDDDLYFVNGSDPGGTLTEAPRDALFRNDGGRFTDVTRRAGLGSPAWGQGCAIGDTNNDGWPDLYVTNLMEPDLLYENRGDGTFADVTGAAGLGDDGWGTGAVFLDIDQDGDRDLYVARYVRFGWEPELAGFPCSWRGLSVACGPRGLEPQPDLLYCNDGTGRFRACGDDRIENPPPPSYGLGVIAVDLDLDADLDLFVANDAMANFLYENRDGRLVEQGAAAGVAVNEMGQPEASMGVAWTGSVFYVTNFGMETDTLYYRTYAMDGGFFFTDATAMSGLEAPTLRHLSWGVVAYDPDLDGLLDFYVASGHIYPQVEEAPDLRQSYLQPDLFLRQVRQGVWRSQPDMLVQVPVRNGRGVAVLDLEGDGDPDLVVNNLDGPPTVLRSEGCEGRPTRADRRRGAAGGSYLSQSGRVPEGVRREQ